MSDGTVGGPHSPGRASVPAADRSSQRPLRRRHPRGRRDRAVTVVAGVILGTLALTIGAGFVAAILYLPLVNEAQQARASLETLAASVDAVGPDVTPTQIQTLRKQLADATVRTQKLADIAQHDPLVNAARMVPPLRDQVDGTRAVLEAGLITLGAAGKGLDLGEMYVEVRDSPLSDASRLGQAAELLATSRADLDAIGVALQRAQAAIDAAPSDLWGPIASARDLVRDELGSVLPVFERLRTAAGVLPGMPSW